jgi:hypothetical protein
MVTNQKDHTFFDTDIFIHRLDPDQPVRTAAKALFDTYHPNAISAFSIVELKGNYIQDLILMRRKVADSDTFEKAAVKIRNTGGRRTFLMFSQLISWIGGISFPINPWEEARRELLTHLDAQLIALWEEFQRSVDKIFDDFSCARAFEGPEDDGEKWTATIPHCQENNTKCMIVDFIKKYEKELKQLLSFFDTLDSSSMTNELFKIKKIVQHTIKNNRFPWEGTTCRSVGDLLIGLQSKVGKELISSNYKEHSQLHKPLEYAFHNFPITNIRSK